MLNRKLRLAVRIASWVTCGTVLPWICLRAATAVLAAQSPPAARTVGTIKSVSGNSIILTSDAGTDVNVQLREVAKLVRIAPGQKDLKDATPIAIADLQTGDRILVRGSLAPDGKSVLASSIIAMKGADITEKQSREREDWQRNGIGGLVSNVDSAANTVTITLPAIGEKKNVIIHLSNGTILRRYAPDSVRFDDAKPAPLIQVKPGDQLRARGTRSPDGSEFTAAEIVSGTFRNIAGTVSAIDASSGTLTVGDLATKTAVTLKITSDSQLRKLPPPMAQRIAARLKGQTGDAASPVGNPAASSNAAAGSNNAQSERFGSRPGAGGPPDLQQVIGRMPPATLADLQKGDAIMTVATQSGPNGVPTAIILLAGVEPILEASPKSTASTILSPWNIGNAAGEAVTP